MRTVTRRSTSSLARSVNTPAIPHISGRHAHLGEHDASDDIVGEALENKLPRPATKPLAKLRISHKRADPRCERTDVPWRNQKAVAVRLNRAPAFTRIGSDHRLTERHRLQQRARIAAFLVVPRQDGNVGHLVDLAHVLPELEPCQIARLLRCNHVFSWNGIR